MFLFYQLASVDKSHVAPLIRADSLQHLLRKTSQRLVNYILSDLFKLGKLFHHLGEYVGRFVEVFFKYAERALYVKRFAVLGNRFKYDRIVVGIVSCKLHIHVSSELRQIVGDYKRYPVAVSEYWRDVLSLGYTL